MTEVLRLWSDEVEGMREEARAAVLEGMAMFASVTPSDVSGLSREERIQQQRAAMPAFPVPEAVEREFAGVSCRTFLPPDGAAPRAVYLHYHGGGMVAGSPALMDVPNRDLARDFGVVVVSADYRKAPEHPYPAGPDDAFAVAAWLVEHAAEEYGTDRLIIGGESAGGYLAALVGLRVRDAFGSRANVLGLNLVFGVYDWGGTPSQHGVRPHDGPDMLSPDGVDIINECYLPGLGVEGRRAPEISPAYADLRGLPPMFMSVGTCDHLLDDTLLVANRAAAAGCEVELFVAPDMPHGFFAFSCGITKLWGERFAAWMERRLDGGA